MKMIALIIPIFFLAVLSSGAYAYETHKLYDINNVEYEACMDNKSLTNEDGDLVEDEDERFEVCSPLETITEMVYEIETEEAILRAPYSPTCYWGDEDKDGKPDDYRTCHQEMELISKEKALGIDSLGTQFQKDVLRDLKITTEHLIITKLIPYYINYEYKYPIGAGKEKYNLTINLGGRDYVIDPEVGGCFIATANNTLYQLNTSIENSGTNDCIDLSQVENTTFECINGATIDGNNNADRGILIGGVNVTARNCPLTDFDTHGVRIIGTDGNADNISVSSCPDNGITNEGDGTTISDSSSISNKVGLDVLDAKGGLYDTLDLADNSQWDFFIEGVGDDCSHKLSNVDGTGSKPVAYFNDTVILENWNNNVSVLVLCGANHSVIDSLTLDATGDRNNGIRIASSFNVSLNHSHVKNPEQGLSVNSNSNDLKVSHSRFELADDDNIDSDSDNALFDNVTCFDADQEGAVLTGIKVIFKNGLVDSNKDDGMIFATCSGCSAINTTFTGHKGVNDIGIRFSSSRIYMANNTLSNNYKGILWRDISSHDVAIGNEFQSNTFADIAFQGDSNANATLYNNIFNSTTYFSQPDIGEMGETYFNTTASSQTNIIGDPAFGGNAWYDPTNYSNSTTVKCVDADTDGYCDNPFNVSTQLIDANCGGVGVCDYLPLSDEYSGAPANNPPTTPNLHLPENNTMFYDYHTLTIPLNWSNSTDADGDAITYYLEIWNDTTQTDLLYANNSITETTNTTGDTFTFPNETGKDFWWRVLATDGTDNSSWSTLHNISFGYTSAVDTCTYAGSGDWNVDCSDDCVISSAVTGDGSNLNIDGTGTFTMEADIDSFATYHISGDCVTSCQGGCFRN